MADDGGKTAGRVALCSAICAGFAFFGYSFIMKTFGRRSCQNGCQKHNGTRRLTYDHSDKVVQTDLSMNCSLPLYDFHISPSTMKRHIKQLNLRSCQFGKDNFHLPNIKAKSLQSSPWTSPRILSAAHKRKYLSLSAENISTTSPPRSPNRLGAMTPGPLHRYGSNCALDDRNAINHRWPPSEDYNSHASVIRGVYNRPRELTSYEVKSIIMLLQAKDEDILVRTLTTVSNCAAFSINQELLCNAGILILLKDLLTYPSEAVRVAATQAVSNLAVSEKNQILFQPLLPILLHHATPKQGGELLRSLSVTALANLALDVASHSSLMDNIDIAMQLLEKGSTTVRLQVLRMLVNLSCNVDMVPLLLKTKVSQCFHDFLDLNANKDITLRCVTFLANIVTAVTKQSIKLDSNSICPETLVSALYGPAKEKFLEKISLLVNGADGDVNLQAKRIYYVLHLQKYFGVERRQSLS